jgi:hypothetical protein
MLVGPESFAVAAVVVLRPSAKNAKRVTVTGKERGWDRWDSALLGLSHLFLQVNPHGGTGGTGGTATPRGRDHAMRARTTSAESSTGSNAFD